MVMISARAYGADLQHPLERSVQLGIDSLQIGKGHGLAKYHLVQARHEIGIQETPMEDGQPHNTTDELEVAQMVRIDAGCGVDLQGIVVVRRIFKQPIARVEYFMRQEEEPFSMKIIKVESGTTSEQERVTWKRTLRHHRSRAHLHHRN